MKLLDEKYFNGKLIELDLAFANGKISEIRNIAKQIAADAREEQAGKVRENIEACGVVMINGSLKIFLSDALAALDKAAKGE